VTTDVTPELAEAIQRGYDQRDRANMAPTIAYFQALLAEHPDHPVLVSPRHPVSLAPCPRITAER